MIAATARTKVKMTKITGGWYSQGAARAHRFTKDQLIT